MCKIFYLGINHSDRLGGVASVLNEYSKIFPDAIFIRTTSSNASYIFKLCYLFLAIIKVNYYCIFYRNAIYHIHGSSYNSFHRKYLIFRILKFYKVRVVYHIHGGEFHTFYEKSSESLKKKISFLIDNVNCIVCLSEKWKIFFNKSFNPRKIEVIPNIVAEPIFIKRKLNLESFSFLFLGNISHDKGIWLLMEVISKMKVKLEGNVQFLIGGNGDVKRLKSEIENKGLDKIVEYLGWVDEEMKVELLNSANALILPSYNEGLPISILEAMSYKLAIVSTKVGGIPAIIKDGFNGFLFQPGNELELSIIFENILNNKDEFINMGKNHSKIIRSYYPKNVKMKLDKLYADLIEN